MKFVNWDKLENAGLAIKIYSRILHEAIWLISKEENVNQVTDSCVIYRMREVKNICDCSPASLRIIHHIKKTFKGEILTESDMNGSPAGWKPSARLRPTRRYLASVYTPGSGQWQERHPAESMLPKRPIFIASSQLNLELKPTTQRRPQ